MLACLLLQAIAASAADVAVVGLFRNAAMISIDGHQQLLRSGESTAEGIRLISANSREAVLEINGEQTVLKLSQHIGSVFTKPKAQELRIQRRDNRYLAGGAINGTPVSFVVDTGATIVAMNEYHARKVGLDLNQGRKRMASTAGGMVNTVEMNVDSIQVGPIRLTNVPVAVMYGRFPEDILLGMSFLSQVHISETAGVMTLKSRF
ncbi:MAG: clan AA aspartic protease [Pseudomonadales bacterium]|nr:clan AA aspartic protease [Pseudomonadales bacterium]